MLRARRTTIERVQTVLNMAFGGGYEVKNFGSTAYGIDHAKSDLDLVLLVSLVPLIFDLV